MKYYYLLAALVLLGCKGEKDKKAILENHTQITKPEPLQTPDKLLGDLFAHVQLAQVFPDGKTFVDCTAKFPYDEIRVKYEQEKNMSIRVIGIQKDA